LEITEILERSERGMDRRAERDRLKKKKDQIWLSAIGKDPEARVLTVAYYALVAVDKIIIDPDAWKSLPGWYGKRPQWFGIHDIPDLAFDHKRIIFTALDFLREKVVTQPIVSGCCR
jgi:hypothetical protein